jgi:alpha-mannosidase
MDKLQASLILEVLGRPKEYIAESLNTLVVKMGSEKGVKIVSKQYHEPTPVKDTKDLFTTFAEVNVELDSLIHYFGIIFSYFPSHIEMISPENFGLSNYELNELGNALVQRLHNYDSVVKQTLAERDILKNKLREVAPHLFKQESSPVKTETKKTKKKSAKKKSR